MTHTPRSFNVLPDNERLLIVAKNIEVYYIPLLNDLGFKTSDAELNDVKTLREIAERMK